MNNTKQIIYNGSLYEALEANQTLRDYAVNAIKALKKWNHENPMYVGNIKDDHDHTFEIETYVELNSAENTNYKTYFDNEKDMNINARAIEIHIPDIDNIDYLQVYYDIIHETLHAIDPKSYDKKLVKNPKIGPINYVKPDGNRNKSEYLNQPLERQVQLSSYADIAINETLRSQGKEYTKNLINSGKILERLPEELRSEKNDREFLRLVHHYYEELLKNG